MSDPDPPTLPKLGSPGSEEGGSDPDAANVVPAGHKSQFMQFLKTLTSFTGDLSQLTCPAFLLSGVSLLEYSAHWADHPELFAAITQHEDPVDRMVAVTRWFISTLYGSFHSRCKTGTEKKPFNPVLGEQFFCYWPSKDTGLETRMVCEQVSHHPPVSAFYIENDAKNIFLNGHCGQKTKFKTTYIKVEQTGRAVVTVHLDDGTMDEYFITLPEMALRGLVTGQLFVELLGKSSITSASGYQTVIEYVPKGWFGGQYHTIKGTISKLDLANPLVDNPSSTSGPSDNDSKASKASKKAKKLAAGVMQAAIDNGEILYEISGQWTSTCTATRLEDGAEEVLFDAETHPMVIPTVKPIAEQSNLECRKLWSQVAAALAAGDYAQGTALKSAIEDEQRSLRKARAERGEPWNPKCFVFISDSGVSSASTSTSTSPTTNTLSTLASPSKAEPVGNALTTGTGSDTGSVYSLAASKLDLAGPGLQARNVLRGLCILASGGYGGTEALVDDGLWTYVPARPSSSLS